MAGENEHTGRTTRKLLDIISDLDEHGAQGVTELANRLDIPKSTIHYHLQVLRDSGYVVQDEKNTVSDCAFSRWETGPAEESPSSKLREEINDLAAVTGELAILMIEEQGLGVILYKQAGDNAVDMDASIGRRARLHDRALGKAILAHLPKERVEEIIQEHGLRQTTARTIHQPEELFETIEHIREQGIAYNRGEAVRGLNGIAVPILDDDEKLLGAISIAGPATHLEDDEVVDEIENHLFQAKNVIELSSSGASRSRRTRLVRACRIDSDIKCTHVIISKGCSRLVFVPASRRRASRAVLGRLSRGRFKNLWKIVGECELDGVSPYYIYIQFTGFIFSNSEWM
ncbi:IclR family transcriptional regulator [Halomicroarcula sp. GCM10025710]